MLARKEWCLNNLYCLNISHFVNQKRIKTQHKIIGRNVNLHNKNVCCFFSFHDLHRTIILFLHLLSPTFYFFCFLYFNFIFFKHTLCVPFIYLRDATLILATPLSHRLPLDKLMWHYDLKGLFLVKSAYKLLSICVIRLLLRTQVLLVSLCGKLFGNPMSLVKWKCVLGGLVFISCLPVLIWRKKEWRWTIFVFFVVPLRSRCYMCSVIVHLLIWCSPLPN